MAMIQPNQRASLLAGLRTGGVRSTSGPQLPHTAAPGGSFQLPRLASSQVYNNFPIDEEVDEVADMISQNAFVSGARSFPNRQVPRTASAYAPNNVFQHQQQDVFQRQLAAQNAVVNGGLGNVTNTADAEYQAQAQAQMQLQMQMMQMEVIRLQALNQMQQNAQIQADTLIQAQRQQQQQNARRHMSGVPEPFSAGPATTSFNQPMHPLAQLRARKLEQYHAQQLDSSAEVVPPMTAALDGRFGSRTVSNGISALNPNASVFVGSRFTLPEDQVPTSGSVPPTNTPATPSYTTVISGGTSLGSSIGLAPSKSDSAVSWRRTSNSVLSGNVNRSVSSSPPVRVSPPPSDTETSGTPVVRARPQPLRFSMSIQPPLPVVAVDSADGSGDESSSYKSDASSSPTTPASAGSMSSLSAREEASKRLYEGLGIGRPLSQSTPAVAVVPVAVKVNSQPTRQPRGPPAAADELGERNFANRLRKKAIGGLGVLMGARERRDSAFQIEVQVY